MGANYGGTGSQLCVALLGDSLASAAYRTILALSPLNTPGSRAGRPSTRSASSRVTGGLLDTLQNAHTHRRSGGESLGYRVSRMGGP